jgi:hypothetical protein
VNQAASEGGAFIDEWIVAFRDAGAVWWRRFLRPGFGHCWAFGFCPRTGHWLVVEPTFSRVVVAVATPRQVEAWFEAAAERRITLVRAPCRDEEVVRPRFFVTCAGCVAALLGMRRYPLTPWGLFRTLRAAGARELRADG